jgi:hypothetical protein
MEVTIVDAHLFLKISRVELHLSRLIETLSHPDMQKIWIIGFFFKYAT